MPIILTLLYQFLISGYECLLLSRAVLCLILLLIIEFLAPFVSLNKVTLKLIDPVLVLPLSFLVNLL
jgi:hypothetical protein